MFYIYDSIESDKIVRTNLNVLKIIKISLNLQSKTELLSLKNNKHV